ncbi:MAG: DMT family transporter [Pararhodobacter sp.]|nr:DMT family transporter [Pararhodobacter sp.]
MCGAIASFTLMAVAGRAVMEELSTFELMFWRSLMGFGIMLPIVMLSARGLAQVRSRQPRLHLGRNVFHFAGQNLWFYGVAAIPLAQLVALEFTMPIWVVLLAPLVLGETLSRRRLGLAALGFAGVLIVAQPGVAPLGPGHLAGILAAVGFALNVMLTKKIMRHDGVLCVLFWMTLLQTLFGLVLSFIGGFTLPSAAIVPWLLVAGVTGLTAHYSLTSALGVAPASVVAPMEFARLPIIALVAVWLYAEALDPFVFLGAAVIFVANYLNLKSVGDRA